ncbi:hypothetical protein GJAV_G00222700 [Gymnothorax javanicus]|nr:hypothetical protein GJAV_G00222700 [Gymnothorax javanicus]
MTVPVLLYLLLLITVLTRPSHLLQDLTCYNDYIRNISCIWNSTGKYSEEHCVLLETRGHGKSCDLKPAEGQDRSLRTCQLVFKQVSGYHYKVTINVTCADSVVASFKDYRPAFNVKMHPPGKPVIAKSNVSWSLGSPHSTMIPSYYFQLQFKLSEQSWENAESWDRPGKIMSVELAEDNFVMGQSYDARVRVRPVESAEDSLKGMWSTWSPTTTWRSEVGEPPVGERSRSLPDPGPQLQVIAGLAAAAVTLLLLICWKYRRAGWVHKLKLPPVPNPSTYFHVLNSVHGGNFQKWLSPMFAPESFDIPQSFEDISAVEVFRAKDVTALLHPSLSNPTDLWDSSDSSASFSNMGYFYSQYQGSYGLEVCPVYFSYPTDTGSSDQEAGGEGDDPLPDGLFYEHLSELPEEPRQMDPDHRKWHAENIGEQDVKDDQKEVDILAPLTIAPFSQLVAVSPSLIQQHPHFPSMPSQSESSNEAPGSSNATAPLEGTLGRSSSERIEPSGGGYMTVREMMNTYCNKSI